MYVTPSLRVTRTSVGKTDVMIKICVYVCEFCSAKLE